MKNFLTISLLILGSLLHPTSAQTVKEILQKSEEIRRGIESSQATVTMTIVRPTWTREMSLKIWSKGEEYAMILVTGPAGDKGTATLKRNKEVWSWLPNINNMRKLPPSMMSQSWMGSDMTNEDLVREVSLIDDYDHRMLEAETIEGRKCWKIELIPHEDVAVIWGKVIMWIDQQDYLQLKTEFYDDEGYLVNMMVGSDIKEMGGRTVASKLEMIPVEEPGKKTILSYNSLSFDDKIPENFFSVQNMKRVR